MTTEERLKTKLDELAVEVTFLKRWIHANVPHEKRVELWRKLAKALWKDPSEEDEDGGAPWGPWPE